jgi:DNA polymerase III subunit epsilon
MNWAEGPLAGFDLETTGTDVESDRIVTACYAVQPSPDADVAAETILADPGVEIPAEASDVHGITTEQARAEGIKAREAAEWVLLRLPGVPFDPMPLVVYNAPFDITIAEREARRHGLFPAMIDGGPSGWPFLPDVWVIDPLVLDKQLDRYRRGSRKLIDTCRHYGITLDDAHNAEADTIAAIRLARAIARAYPQIAQMSLKELHDFQVKAKAEQSASFQDYLRRKGSDEVVDGSWPMAPWTGPEPAVQHAPVPDVAVARERVLAAALRCLSAQYAEESADADAYAEYADEQLALAARTLVDATDAQSADAQPVGWS